MSDLISREWVLNKIREREQEPNYQHISEDWCVGLIMAESIVDSAPTIEPTLYGYKLEHLAFVAALLQNKGVTEENLADVINCVDWVVGLVLENMKERVIQSVMGQSKKVEPYAYSPSNCGAKMQSTMGQAKPQEPVNDGGDNR